MSWTAARTVLGVKGETDSFVTFVGEWELCSVVRCGVVGGGVGCVFVVAGSGGNGVFGGG